MRTSKKAGIGVVVFLTVAVAFSLFAFQTMEYKSGSNLEVIKLEEFQNLVQCPESKSKIYVYVGRDSCPTCTTIYPTLCAIKNKNKIEMLYYSTEPDRDTRPEIMNAFLETLNIDRVPMVLVIADGMVQDVYDGEKFVEVYF